MRIDKGFRKGFDSLNGFVQSYNSNISYYTVKTFYLNSPLEASLKSVENNSVSEILPSQISSVNSGAFKFVDSKGYLSESNYMGYLSESNSISVEKKLPLLRQ